METQLTGPDLKQGISIDDLADGAMLGGYADGEAVLLVRRGGDIHAIGATCTHYGGPLAEGLLVGDTVRCPWHHACFDLRTGEALRAPALNPVAVWEVETRGDKVFVTTKREAPPAPRPLRPAPSSIGIIGGGAAGNAACEMLRRRGFTGAIAVISAEETLPVDRPNLSKDYLAGNAPEEWIPLRTPEFYRERGIELHLGARAGAIDRAGRHLQLEDGSRYSYDTLLMATGADPVRLPVPGSDL